MNERREICRGSINQILDQLFNLPVYMGMRKLDYFDLRAALVRIPTLSDTCSNSCRTAFQSCRTVIGAKRRAG